MDPNNEKKSLLNILLPFGISSLKVAFIYEKTPGSSAWTYAHELGRIWIPVLLVLSSSFGEYLRIHTTGRKPGKRRLP